MKNKILVLLLLVIALIFAWYWLQEKSADDTNNSSVINTTGKQDVEAQNPKKAEPEKQKKIEKTPVNITDWEVAAVVDSDRERNYMDVYRDLKFSKRCHEYYKEEQKQKGAFDSGSYFLERIINPLVTSYDPTEEQLASFREFIQACNSLKKSTFIRAGFELRFPKFDKKYPVVAELEKELEETMATTPAERSLQNALKLKKQWNELRTALMTESKGEFVMSKEERKAAQDELISMSQEMMAMTDEGAEIDPEEMMAFASRVQELQEAMDETTGANDDARAQLLVEFESRELELRRLLQSEHLETFLVAMSALEFAEGFDLRVAVEFDKFQFKEINKHVPEYISPSHVLSEMTGIADKKYYDALIGPASALYLCQRGYDCSETSDLVTDFCWGPTSRAKMMSSQIHPQACGLGVKDFIQNNLMTKNQAKDVQELLKLMGEIYAP